MSSSSLGLRILHSEADPRRWRRWRRQWPRFMGCKLRMAALQPTIQCSGGKGRALCVVVPQDREHVFRCDSRGPRVTQRVTPRRRPSFVFFVRSVWQAKHFRLHRLPADCRGRQISLCGLRNLGGGGFNSGSNSGLWEVPEARHNVAHSGSCGDRILSAVNKPRRGDTRSLLPKSIRSAWPNALFHPYRGLPAIVNYSHYFHGGLRSTVPPGLAMASAIPDRLGPQQFGSEPSGGLSS